LVEIKTKRIKNATQKWFLENYLFPPSSFPPDGALSQIKPIFHTYFSRYSYDDNGLLDSGLIGFAMSYSWINEVADTLLHYYYIVF